MTARAAEKGQYALTDTQAHEEADSTYSNIDGNHDHLLTAQDTELGCNLNASWKESIMAWRVEVAAWLFSCACTVALVLVLSQYNDKPSPKWHYGLTLNTLTALLVTIARVALSVPIVECISQLKWLWYTSVQTRPMMDFQRFDKASRGLFGSLSFLAHPQCFSLASLGAVLIILLLALDPITQQSLSYPQRFYPDSKSTASTVWSQSYTAGEIETYEFSGAADIQAQSALSQGLTFPGILQPVQPVCSSGNCTFPDINTLGICASVASVTNLLNHTCDNITSSCNVTIPGSFTATEIWAASFNVLSTNSYIGAGDCSPAVFSDADILPATDIFVFWRPSSYGTTSGQTNLSGPDFVAYELSLAYCVQTLQTVVADGSASTVVVDIQTKFDNNSAEVWDGILELNGTPTLEYNGTMFNITTQAGIYLMLQTMFNGSYYYGPQGAISSDTTLGIQAFREAVNADDFAGLERVWQNVATSMTNDIRSNPGNPSSDNITSSITNGTAYTQQAYVEFFWPWVLPLVIVDVACLVFMLLVIFINGRRRLYAWKSSSIPTLNALARDDRKLLNGLRGPDVMEEAAESMTMSLRADGREARLFVM